MSKFSFCYHTVALKKGKPMEGFHKKSKMKNCGALGLRKARKTIIPKQGVGIVKGTKVEHIAPPHENVPYLI